jgi:hypothetical protein
MHIQTMERTIALAIVAAFIVFVTIYGLSIWRRSK